MAKMLRWGRQARAASAAALFMSFHTSLLIAKTAADVAEAAPERIASIVDCGAVGDGKRLNTESIQTAIDKLAAAGGGTLVVPKGVFVSGAIFLKPGVSLRLDKEAVLKGSTEVHDYPKRLTRIEGHSEPWLPALVNAEKMNHLSISGEGTLDGSGQPFWAAFWQRRKENPKCTNLEVERPRLMFIDDCRNVRIDGITLKDSGFWNLHLYRCTDVRVRKLDIHAGVGTNLRPPSSDGMDIDSCQRVEVEGCSFAVNDDCIALKGTKGPFALEDKQSLPVEQVHITGCTFNAGHAALTCGSEATTITAVDMERCTVNGAMPLLHLKLRPDTPQNYSGIEVHNITMHAGTIFDVSPWTQFFDLKGQPPPQSVVQGVTISGVTGSFESLGAINPTKGVRVSKVTLKDVNATLKSVRFDHAPIDGLRIENVTVNGSSFTGD